MTLRAVWSLVALALIIVSIYVIASDMARPWWLLPIEIVWSICGLAMLKAKRRTLLHRVT